MARSSCWLLVSIRRHETEEMLPPPAPVTMLFESGRRQGPTLPEPSPQATPSVEAPPAEDVPLPTPPVPPAEPPPPAPRVETAPRPSEPLPVPEPVAPPVSAAGRASG